MEGTEQTRRRRRRKAIVIAVWAVLTTAAVIYARCGRERASVNRAPAASSL